MRYLCQAEVNLQHYRASENELQKGGPDSEPQAHGEGANREPEGGPRVQPEERKAKGLGHPTVIRFVRRLKSAKASQK